MKVVKYYLTAQIVRGDKEEKVERTFRHLKNAKEFVKQLVSKEKVKCGEYTQKDSLITRECEGEKVKIKVEIKVERIKKIKKEEEKKEEKKEQQQQKQ